MRTLWVCLVGLAVAGCQGAWQRLEERLEQYPPSYLRVLEATRSVLARRYVVTNVDRVHGVVEASSVVRANSITKYRTKATARVFQTGPEAYDVEARVTNELEVSEPSLLGGGQPPHDWRAVGFDHLAETALMAELQAQLMGQTVTATPRPSHLLFSAPRPLPVPSSLLRPNIPDPVGGAEKPAPAPKPQASPAPTPAPTKTSQADLVSQYLALGDRHWQERDLDEALLAYRRAAEAAPGSPAGHLALAGVWTSLRRYAAGAAALREAATAANGSRVQSAELARLRGPADELGERLLLLKGWCKQQPSDVDGRLLLAYHYLLAGRPDDARASLEEVTRAKPQDAAARFLAQQLSAAQS